MSIKLDNVPVTPLVDQKYPVRDWVVFFQQVYNAIKGGDIDIIRQSPDGTRWRLGVDNAGNSVWTAI